MSTGTIGEKLRQLRAQQHLTLRRVSAIMDIDVAILSKMERGERKLTKEVVRRLADIYKYNVEELLVLFLSDKILYELQDEDLAEKALIVAKKRVANLKWNKSK